MKFKPEDFDSYFYADPQANSTGVMANIANLKMKEFNAAYGSLQEQNSILREALEESMETLAKLVDPIVLQRNQSLAKSMRALDECRPRRM